MKKLLMALVALTLAMGVYAEPVEVYVAIPGEKPVHCMNAEVEMTGSLVTVSTPWGVTYTTHLANVIIIHRNNK